jgi:ubiquinone/menaquinone biosynthesis C-methylase UbiE
MTPKLPRQGAQQAAADYYDRVAETWDETHGVGRQNTRFASQLRENLRTLLADVAPTGVALELGAGTGPYVDITAPLFGKLIASDLSAGMLAMLARRLERLGLGNVTPLRQDACDLRDVASESVDVVYSIGLIETVGDLARLFGESHRVLRPGGVVAGITSNGDCPWYRLRTRLEGGERHGRTGYLLTARDLEQALRQAGFHPPRVQYWGAVPPGLRSPLLIRTLAAVETLVVHTRLAGYLGVLSFNATKPARAGRDDRVPEH